MLSITFAAFIAGGALALLAGPRAGERERVAPAPNTALLRVASQFYDGLNVLLAMGDATQLLAQLDPHFVSYASTHTDHWPAAMLIADMHSLRSAFPNARVEVTSLDTRGDLVFATVRITNGGAGEFVGIGLDRLPQHPFDDVLRIRDGVLTERWGANWSRTSFLNIASDIVSVPAGASVVPELRRWRIEPNGFGESFGDAWRFLVVEAGSIGWAISPDSIEGAYLSFADGSWQPARASNRLEAGYAVVLPRGATARFWNPDAIEARMLVVEVPLASVASTASSTENSGVTRSLLARGLLVRPGDAGITVSIGQLRLPSSESWHHAGMTDGGEMLLVTDGSVHASTDDGLYWVVNEDSSLSHRHATQVDAGHGVAIGGRAGRAYQAIGPETSTAWVITFIPADARL